MTNLEMAEFIARTICKCESPALKVTAESVLAKCKTQEELDRWFCICVKVKNFGGNEKWTKL